MDLLEAMPQLLPIAISWAQEVAADVQAVGLHLNENSLAVARLVGVHNPEKIRVKIVAQRPTPETLMLREAATQAGLLWPRMAGLTLGYSILIRQDQNSLRLLSHECRHVHQFESIGSIADFLPIYLQQIVSGGYENAPLEIDARNHELSI